MVSHTLKPTAPQLWEAALGRLQVQITRPTFDTWLRDTTALSMSDSQLVIGVPTTFAAEWLELRLYQLIDAAVASVSHQRLEISFQVRGATSAIPVEASSPLLTPPEAAPMRQVPASPSPSPLNRRYTFDSFVVDATNQLAYAACHAVADRPGDTYNPLFIYSGAGLGKTHLLHAIAHEVRAHERTALYITAEEFTNDFIAAIQDRKTTAFRDRYQAPDVLLVDDIQFISGKERTQEGFFHTFNALHNDNLQIVLASDRDPSALALLEDRLRSRFEWGLVADIQAPSRELRHAILQRRATETQVPIPQDALTTLSELPLTNIRQVEGILNRVGALAHFTGLPVTTHLVQQVLHQYQTPTVNSKPSAETIIAVVAEAHGLTPKILASTRRDRQTADARHTAMFLLSEILQLPTEEIGHLFGNRDRTTAIYSIRKIKDRITNNPAKATELNKLKQALLQSKL